MIHKFFLIRVTLGPGTRGITSMTEREAAERIADFAEKLFCQATEGIKPMAAGHVVDTTKHGDTGFLLQGGA